MTPRPLILDPQSPGMYRSQRGLRGDDPVMVPEGQRVPITTGESKLPIAGAAPWRSAFDPDGIALAVIVLIALLFVIHARFTFGTQFQVGTRGR